jgi:hypothetical protein
MRRTEKAQYKPSTVEDYKLMRISIFITEIHLSDPFVASQIQNLKLSYRILGNDFSIKLGSHELRVH